MHPHPHPHPHLRSNWRALACGALSLIALAPALAAQASTPGLPGLPGRPLAIEDWYRIRTLGAPVLSPDGKWVAFLLSTHVEATNADSSEVWLVAADGASPARRVSPPGMQAGNPEWLDDGRLQFQGAGRRWSLPPAQPDSLSELRLDAPISFRGPSNLTSPDNRWIASLRNTPSPAEPRVYASDFERRHEERFRGVQFDWLEFQRDGAPFPVPNAADPAVNPPQEILLAPVGGKSERQLTRLGLRPQGLQWSRDGAGLLFTADSSYRDERRYEHSQIWSVGVDGAVRRLSPDLDLNYTSASYSPDGRWILYTRQLSTDAVIARRMDNGGPTDLAVMPAGGGPERILTAGWDYLPTGTRWSPDGKYVYFTGGVGGTNHLFRVRPEGGPVEQLTSGQRRLAGFAFDRSLSRMAYLVGVLESPPELYSADLDGKHERQLTHLQDDFTREVALQQPERLRFKSRDGTGIEGWLYRPYNDRPAAGPYPLLVFSHGGPHSAVGYSFDFKLQYFAANGYFVLTTNFRGSTGYGEKFLWATWGGWGNQDGEDVMAGIDHVIAHYPIDPKRVGTVGHSYGGFLSNWLITQYPERFAAAAVGAGIVNWLSDYGTADIARTKETEFYGTPWEPRARELMIRQSPLSYANRVRAATLFLNGELDQRVPYSEAEQLYVALKKNGVPARVIQYAGQPHGIAGSWNIVHRMLNELRWFNTWLKPGQP
jgi:dipeptidyl aminopeptidase/acylaminoacyl peptidase